MRLMILHLALFVCEHSSQVAQKVGFKERAMYAVGAKYSRPEFTNIPQTRFYRDLMFSS